MVSPGVLPLAAFPGAEGFGTETVHGRGGIVVQVTNLNDSGAGSLREALRTEGARIIIFRVSGTIFLDSIIKMGGEHSDCGVFGQTAPGGGICIAAASAHGEVLVQISNFKQEDATIDECHDVVFQHVRNRHGARNRGSIANQDVIRLHSGTNNVVLDHCSFTWGSDEIISMWNQNADDDTILTMHDITISNCIIGESDNLHNFGVHFSGGAGIVGKSIYNISYHHNYSAHMQARDINVDAGSGDSSKGVQCINNVHYDTLTRNGLGQNQYGHEQTFFDSINECYIRSSREPANGANTTRISRIFTLNGDSQFKPFDDIFHDVSLYVDGSIYREVDLSTISGRVAGESDNTLWIVKQYAGNSSQGGPYDGGETFVTRGSQFSTQPDNPVTVTTALQAHTDLIVNGDCGALPHDSVDARIVASCLDGTVYDQINVPGDPGSSATWPTLTDTGAPTDTSGNGLPDSYQVGVLGKSAGDTYNPANTFTVGNGYSDIENWIHTL